MNHHDVHDQVREYYEAKLRAHGATPPGVDWKSAESQELRFRELSRLWEDDRNATVLDYGCGYGALVSYIRLHGHRGAFTGFDLSRDMIRAATAGAAGLPDCCFTADRHSLQPSDYTVASGVFNVKMDVSDDQWLRYLLDTVADMASLSRRGFAFNALTLYSDPEKRRGDLYYADPLMLFDHCKRQYSRRVTLLHDYPLYEFTIIVRLD